MRQTVVVSSLIWFVALGGIASAEDISGTITSTRFITEDSQLVGNVTCTTMTEPCLDLAASHITLRLNGFTITGPADPENGVCNATSGNPQADGIRVMNVSNVNILGPGTIQKFRRHGLFAVGILGERTRLRVRGITSHHNCFSGLFTNGVSASVIEEIVSIRNGINSTAAPCGGNCLVNSHFNTIRRNVFAGNGSVANNSNDFGVGLISLSSGNLIERNTIAGNTNGILIQGNARENTIGETSLPATRRCRISKDHGVAVGSTSGRSDDRWRAQQVRPQLVRQLPGPGPAVCASYETSLLNE
jgi:parallel beta-helix repeat protein